MKKAALLLLLVTAGCTETRVKRYQTILNPLLGAAKKDDVNRKLGEPTLCKAQQLGEQCEYRTAAGRNDPIPAASRKSPLGPDLSPYDYFDVLDVEYDGMGIFKDWTPRVIQK